MEKVLLYAYALEDRPSVKNVVALIDSDGQNQKHSSYSRHISAIKIIN
jgi:hypothetical protein